MIRFSSNDKIERENLSPVDIIPLTDVSSNVDKKIEIKDLIAETVGMCSTSADTALKEVTITNGSGIFSLTVGAKILVTFTNANTATNPTLNVNNTSAAAISWHGKTDRISWDSGSILEFVYTGSVWECVSLSPSDEVITENSKNNITSGAVYTALNEKVDKIAGKSLSDENFTSEEKTKLSSLSNYDDSTLSTQVASNTSAITILNSNNTVEG
nr:hypothetical protein [Treponema sp.]